MTVNHSAFKSNLFILLLCVVAPECNNYKSQVTLMVKNKKVGHHMSLLSLLNIISCYIHINSYDHCYVRGCYLIHSDTHVLLSTIISL